VGNKNKRTKTKEGNKNTWKGKNKDFVKPAKTNKKAKANKKQTIKN